MGLAEYQEGRERGGAHCLYMEKSVRRATLLSTTSEFMAVNLRGQGRSPEAKDVACHKFLCSGQ